MEVSKKVAGGLSETVTVVDIGTPSSVIITETVAGKVVEFDRSPAEDNTVVGGKPLLSEGSAMDSDSPSVSATAETVEETVSRAEAVENSDWLDKNVLYAKETPSSMDVYLIVSLAEKATLGSVFERMLEEIFIDAAGAKLVSPIDMEERSDKVCKGGWFTSDNTIALDEDSPIS